MVEKKLVFENEERVLKSYVTEHFSRHSMKKIFRVNGSMFMLVTETATISDSHSIYRERKKYFFNLNSGKCTDIYREESYTRRKEN